MWPRRPAHLNRSASTATLGKETDVIALRPLHWPDDRASLLGLDKSFTTDRVFHLQQTNHGFKLDEATAEPPIHKSYSLVDDRGVESAGGVASFVCDARGSQDRAWACACHGRDRGRS